MSVENRRWRGSCGLGFFFLFLLLRVVHFLSLLFLHTHTWFSVLA